MRLTSFASASTAARRRLEPIQNQVSQRTEEISMPTSALPLRPYPDCPLVVAYGLGVDSTAMLIEFAMRGIRPDLILFADTGGEKPETYQYLKIIRPYLARVGFPD